MHPQNREVFTSHQPITTAPNALPPARQALTPGSSGDKIPRFLRPLPLPLPMPRSQPFQGLAILSARKAPERWTPIASGQGLPCPGSGEGGEGRASAARGNDRNPWESTASKNSEFLQSTLVTGPAGQLWEPGRRTSRARPELKMSHLLSSYRLGSLFLWIYIPFWICSRINNYSKYNLFLKTVLLRYNSHIIQLIHLKFNSMVWGHITISIVKNCGKNVT